MGFLFGFILILVGIVVILAITGKGGPNMVITGPGVRKIHDVECKFRSDGVYHGDLDQSRWSDGQERMEMNLSRLPGAYTGTVRMMHNGQHVADFDCVNGRIKFAWKGQADADNPLFEIGDEVVLELGSQRLTGIVEAD